jgi:hypothetical protein
MRRKPTLYKFALLAAALLPAAACLPLQAGTLVDIDVVDRDSGRGLPEYRHRGRTWVPGEPGHRYAVRLANRTGERVLVVLSVDGVNAVSGETASPSQAGYVLSPWESTEIAGWRKSLDDVAQFYFTDLPDSYAARTGRPDDVGVIGIAVFRERPQPIPYPLPGPPIAREGEYDRAAKAASGERSRGRRYGVRRRGQAPAHRHRPWRARMGAGRSDRIRTGIGATGAGHRAALRRWRGAGDAGHRAASRLAAPGLARR